MPIKSLAELKKLRDDMQASLRIRNEGEDVHVTEILVGLGTCGIAAGARDTFQALLDEINNRNLEHIKIIAVGCIGYCSMEPTVELHIPGRESVIYGKITKDIVPELIETVVLNKGYLNENLLIKTFEKVGV